MHPLTRAHVKASQGKLSFEFVIAQLALLAQLQTRSQVCKRSLPTAQIRVRDPQIHLKRSLGYMVANRSGKAQRGEVFFGRALPVTAHVLNGSQHHQNALLVPHIAQVAAVLHRHLGITLCACQIKQVHNV